MFLAILKIGTQSRQHTLIVMIKIFTKISPVKSSRQQWGVFAVVMLSY